LPKKIGDKATEGTTSTIWGSLPTVGTDSQALENYQQALAIAKEIGDKATEGTTLNNIGVVYNSLGQYLKPWSIINKP
jgi:hypothetical protein